MSEEIELFLIQTISKPLFLLSQSKIQAGDSFSLIQMFHVKHLVIVCTYQLFTIVSRLPLSIIYDCNNPNLSPYPLLFCNLRRVSKKMRETDYPFSMYAVATFTFTIKNLSRGFTSFNKMFHVKHLAIVCNYQLFTIVSRLQLSVVYRCQLFVIVIIRIYPITPYYFAISAV